MQRLTLVFIAFSFLVPVASLPILSAIFPTGWLELASGSFWWSGIVYAVTTLVTIKAARGPIGLLVSTWFFGSAATVILGTAIWLLTLEDWYFAPLFFLGYTVLPALPGLMIASLLSAWIKRLPSMRSEIIALWGSTPGKP